MHPPDERSRFLDEQSWALRVRNGEVRALEEAFHACYAGMCAYVRAHVRSAEIAEDLVQDVFLRVWQTRNRIEVSGSLRNLLYRSAHNAALNHLKHRRIEDKWLHHATTSYETRLSDSDPAAVDELHNAIDEALARLPERARMMFFMSRFDGLSYSAIARTLDVSIKTVETQMGRALKSLRSSLAPYIT